MTKLLPSYVGSKSYWVPYLEFLRNEYIVELFCGSCVISVNLASKAILNDLDPYIYKILTNFDHLVVPGTFTQEDYFKVRKLDNWWLYSYNLLKMSFSGVFRYSKNGFNVPIKKYIKNINVTESYKEAAIKLKELNPVITNKSYNKVYIPEIEKANIILDPPYEKSQASYNKNFDYHLYWEYINYIKNKCKRLIIFDSIKNIPVKGFFTRRMRVNGKRKGDLESMFIFDKSLNNGKIGEKTFYKIYKKQVKWLDGFESDFELIKSGKRIELKTDFYDMEKTKNFFLERYSKYHDRSPGGPWQALSKGSYYFYYFFIKNGVLFLFKTKELVKVLDKITENIDLISISNVSGEGWTTKGYKVPREDLSSIFKKVVVKSYNKKIIGV